MIGIKGQDKTLSCEIQTGELHPPTGFPLLSNSKPAHYTLAHASSYSGLPPNFPVLKRNRSYRKFKLVTKELSPMSENAPSIPTSTTKSHKRAKDRPPETGCRQRFSGEGPQDSQDKHTINGEVIFGSNSEVRDTSQAGKEPVNQEEVIFVSDSEVGDPNQSDEEHVIKEEVVSVPEVRDPGQADKETVEESENVGVQEQQRSKVTPLTPTAEASYLPNGASFPKFKLKVVPTETHIFFRDLEVEENYIPFLEEVCSWHPSLIECQQKRSLAFSKWAFTALGRVLHFLKTTKLKDMNEGARVHLQNLWEELEMMKFDLTWLEPHVRSVLSLDTKKYLEKREQVKQSRDKVAAVFGSCLKFSLNYG